MSDVIAGNPLLADMALFHRVIDMRTPPRLSPYSRKHRVLQQLENWWREFCTPEFVYVLAICIPILIWMLNP